MIFGVGIDVFSQKRMSFLKNIKFDSFVDKTFTEKERLEAENREDRVAYLTARFSVKEAVYKCIAGRICLDFKPEEIEVLNNANGMPVVTLYGRTKEKLMVYGSARIHASLSYEDDIVTSIAMIEMEN